MKFIFINTILYFVLIHSVKAQTGNLQIYCKPGVNIYVNQYKGKPNADMSGLLLENISAKDINIRAVCTGCITQNIIIKIEEGKTIELKIDVEKEKFTYERITGVAFHFGTFGLFNVNNVFTKADYSAGFTPFFDIKFHPYFAVGFEVMSIWGKPQTNDAARLMVNPNFRIRTIFSPVNNINIDILIASGLAFWPKKSGEAFLTPTFNEQRIGWDFRAAAGAEFLFTKKIALMLNFGYWASSSTSDNIVWITHDSMILSLGPVIRF